MTTYEISYLILVVIQTAFLIWYAIETFKLRKAAAAQTEIIQQQRLAITQQLALQSEQNVNIQKDFERKFAREDMEARPFLRWRNDSNDNRALRWMTFENLGAEIMVVEMKCSNPTFHLEPTPLIKGNGAEYKLLFPFDVGYEIYFGFKYLNRFKELKTLVYYVAANDTKIIRNDKPYESVGVTRIFVQKGHW